MFTKSSYFTSLKNDPKTSYDKRMLISMEVRLTISFFILLTTFPTISYSTSISCNSTQICLGGKTKNASVGIDSLVTECCRNNTSPTSDTNLVQNSGNSSGTSVIPTNALHIFTISNGTSPCLNNSFCSGDEVCLSVKCLTTRNTPGQSTQCLCHQCGDGRCFNKTVFKVTTQLPPTTIPPQGITTLQLVLLFGSMGGIVVIICIVYCVKSFTDNRQRQYLLKHGVWDTPRDDKQNDGTEENGQNESKSEQSREESKMEVPTIRVQLENEISKSKESEIGKSINMEEDEDLDDETEEVVKPKIGPKIQPDIIQVKGYAPIPNEPSPYHENANPNRSTKDPSIEKTIDRGTIEAPTENNDPALWNKDLSNSPLTHSPVKNSGFSTRSISKDPPKKIIANGTPEKSPKFNHNKRATSPPRLVEPENFSDFGM